LKSDLPARRPLNGLTSRTGALPGRKSIF